ncbi:cmpk1, partial [Symbiodinium natans]
MASPRGANICAHFPHWSHISAGDCLRAERSDPNSKDCALLDGELINSFIKEGKIVPVEITVRLLEKAMRRDMALGKTDFLIDGFPRNLDNVTGWEQVIGDGADVLGVLFFEATETEMEKRLLERSSTSGRVDDNLESIRKRFRTYEQETKPIVE